MKIHGDSTPVQRVLNHFKRSMMLAMIAALVVGLSTGALSSPAKSDTSSTSTEASTAEAGVDAETGGAEVVEAKIDLVAYNPYGCVGLLSTRQMHIMAFALGWCPTTWILQNTSWGRSFVNWIVNGVCRNPSLVRTITRGAYSRC